ncbi:MAG: DNA-directed RNA polymerase subunit omega [Bacillota bacterium]
MENHLKKVDLHCRYILVSAIAKRARQIMMDSLKNGDDKAMRAVYLAQKEIEQGKLHVEPGAALYS